MESRSEEIDSYILGQPPEVRRKLTTLRQLIRRAAPEAKEKISYGMPTFWLNGNLVHFAARARHIGLYPTSSPITKFKRELARYVTSKGAIQFPLEEPLPLELIRKIVRFRVEQNRGKSAS
ncbi:MAG TPA: DUF1801 domain-containing protein [Spirochaetia bacterium]|nr:DUF1801 domain-containing protein [Spirochaetia bacterium]